MRFARRESAEPSLDLTSLIDVVFLLLIFFMVTTRFIDGPKLSLKLPAASEAAQTVSNAPIVIVVDAHNRFYVGGQRIPAARLAAVLSTRHQRNPQRTLVLRADERANHGAVVRVLNIAAGQGFDSVDIAVTDEGT